MRPVNTHPTTGTGTGIRHGFRRVGLCTFWRLGFRQSSFRHITRVSQHPVPNAWTRLLVGWHAVVPFTFRIQVSHQTQGCSSNPSPLRGGYVSEVDPGRPAGVTAGGFSRAASRTRRAPQSAPGSPQAPMRIVGYLMCLAMVLGCVFPGSSSAWRVLGPGRTAPRHRRWARCRSVDAVVSRGCVGACVPAT